MDNYGWDVVYACSGEYINRQLANNADKLIQSFIYEDSAVKISGQFGAWRIVPGGSGPLLQFETPITSGEVYFKKFNETISLNGVIPLVQMQLKLIKGSNQQVARTLVFNCTTVGKKRGDTTPGAVTVINPDTSGALAKYLDKAEAAWGAAVLTAGLGAVFTQNANQLDFVFGDMLPVPTGQNADWLTPVNVAYAYQQPINNSLGGIAILGMLSNRSIDSLPRNFDTNLLLNKDFGFILSGQAFMQNVIIPSLPAAFQGNCHMNDFSLNSNGSITMRERFDLNSVRVGLIDYTPTVTAVNYHIDDSSIRCYVATSTDISGLSGAYVTNSVTSNNMSAFNVSSRTLSFLADNEMTITKDSHIPCWEQAIGILTLGIMNIVIDAISLAIQNSVGNLTSSKTAQSLGKLAPGLVTWSGQQSITVNAGGLANNIYMQGSLN
ncbi:TULIP family P47-like protein [Burkholderia sp. TSV86]|uniref:TULIP family P47-like protein n=1 Tax=Burkholderia sp. TSV86 TaxID=1385594 RepID=UPI0009ECB446|nr:TULIP family P47-like protein [Burkholderia sp. TSV86]